MVLPIANHLYVRFFRVALEPAAAGRAGALDEISGLVLGAVTWPMAVFMAVIPLGLLLWAVIRGTKTRMPRLIPVLVSAGACGLLMAAGAIAGNQCWHHHRPIVHRCPGRRCGRYDGNPAGYHRLGTDGEHR